MPRGSGSSITAHRLFVPGLALWFGALFGLSSLAIGTALFEQLVTASRIDQIVPAAAPPLGHAARLLLAFAFGLVGALIGWGVAKAIAALPGGQMSGLDAHYAPTPFDPARPEVHSRQAAPEPEPYQPEPYQVRARDAHPDAPARRPILAREELRDAALGRPLEPLGASVEAATPPAPEMAPMPQAVPQPAPAAEPEVVPEAAEAFVPVAPAPLTVAAPPPAPVLPRFVAEPEDENEMPRLGPAREQAAPQPPSIAEVAPVSAPPPPPVEPAPPPPQPAAAQPAAARIVEAAPASLSHVELIERLAIAMRRREAAQEQAPPTADPATALADAGAAMRDALAGLKDSGGN